MIVVNTNPTSLIAQNNLTQSTSDMTQAINRLSSGYRINTAADDPAGLAVASPLQSRVAGLYQASRNALESTNVADIADSTLSVVQDNLTRIRQISVQAANGIYNKQQRSNLQLEIDQLTQEISRLVKTTNYNGYQLFSARKQQFTFQIGADGDGRTISGRKAARVNKKPAMSDRQGASNKYRVVNGESLRRAAPRPIENAGNSITVNFDKLTGKGKRPGLVGKTISGVVGFGMKVAKPVVKITVGIPSNIASKVPVVKTVAQPINRIATNFATKDPRTKGLNSFDNNLAAKGSLSVKTQSAARQAVKDATADIELITKSRAQFGALSNRFKYVQRTNDAVSQASESSISRIMDADYARESSNYAASQIRQQAGAAVLAQANAMPQIALTLLR